MPEPGAILALNAGSSSVKVSVFGMGGDAPALLGRGQIEALATAPRFVFRDAEDGAAPRGTQDFPGPLSHAEAIGFVLRWLGEQGLPRLVAAGHRIVHGGARFTRPVLLGAAERAALAELVPLAPLHQPHNLAGVEALAALLPGLPQVGCFDTAFHATMPEAATTLALPAHLRARGLRRYGFHGLSYEHVSARLPHLLPEAKRRRVIAAHLGNGASLCALRDGKSIDTTMGFSTLDGLVMGARPGSLAPGVLLFLMRERRRGAAALEDLLYRQSGLLGLSGLSADMRTLETSRDPAARAAIDVFVHRLVQHIGAMAAVLGGLDALVFTGGIGENSPRIRELMCKRLGWMGVRLHTVRNELNYPELSPANAKVPVLIVPADEEGVIARHVVEALRENTR